MFLRGTGSAPFLEAIKVAFGSLRSSKLRSFLTLLGIILATATLITVMSVIHGMDVYIAQNVSDMRATAHLVPDQPAACRLRDQRQSQLVPADQSC